MKREPLNNFFSEQVVRVWLMLDPRNDLQVEEVGDDGDQDRPEWLQNELDQVGWEDIGSFDNWQDRTTKDADGNEWSEGRFRWGLHNGIAPGQPFLLELPFPHYSKSWTECGYEYDVEFYPEVVKVERWTEKRILRAWEKELDLTIKTRKAEAEHRRKLNEKRRTDLSAMFLSSDVYMASGSYYDDMAMPDGVRYRLCSKATLKKGDYAHWVDLAWGEDPKGDWEVAMKKLVESAQKTLPHLTEVQIRAMPRVSRF